MREIKFTTHISPLLSHLYTLLPPLCTGVIDREMMPSHTFYVTAVDGGGESQTVNYMIEVTDENDHAPRFLLGDFRFFVPESQMVCGCRCLCVCVCVCV